MKINVWCLFLAILAVVDDVGEYLRMYSIFICITRTKITKCFPHF